MDGAAGAAPAGLRPTDASSTTAPTSTGPAAAPVVAAEGTVTLPLFGAPLTVDIATDPGGALASVSVNPADGWTAVQDRPNKVAFVNADGTAKVRVSARHGGTAVSATGSTLADITGPGGWSGDVFGTGTTTSVAFRIGAAADGGPDITGVTSTDPSAVIGATQHHSRTGDGHEDGHEDGVGGFARVSVTFTSGGRKRTLTITAMVRSSGDSSHAGVAVTLSGIRGALQAAADAAGAKTWSGMLCDGTKATIGYTVGADGTISAVSATPSTGTVAAEDNEAKVTFVSGEQVKIEIRSRDGQIAVQVELRFHCATTDPSVNTPTSTVAPGGDDHGDHNGDNNGEDHGNENGNENGNGGRNGDGRDGHHDATTTTTVVDRTGSTTTTTVDDNADHNADDNAGDDAGDHGGSSGGNRVGETAGSGSARSGRGGNG